MGAIIMASVHSVNFDLVLFCDFCGEEKKIKAVLVNCDGERIILDQSGRAFQEAPALKSCSSCLTSSGFLDRRSCYKECRECIKKIFPGDTSHLPTPLFSTHSAHSESYSSVSFDRGGMTISRGGAPGIQYKEDCILF
jgi:hypothetical protein